LQRFLEDQERFLPGLTTEQKSMLRNMAKRRAEMIPTRAQPLPKLEDLRGSFSGILQMKCTNVDAYLSSLSSFQPSAHDELNLIKRALQGVECEVDVSGYDWKVGIHELGSMKFQANVLNGIAKINPCLVFGPRGFSINANGMLDSHSGGIKGSISVKKVSARMISRYAQLPVRLKGFIGSEVIVSGNWMNPSVDVKTSWSRGMINRQRVTRALGSVTLDQGRCKALVSMQIGKRMDSARLKQDRLRNIALIESDHERRKEIESEIVHTDSFGEPFRIQFDIPMPGSIPNIVRTSYNTDTQQETDESVLNSKGFEAFLPQFLREKLTLINDHSISVNADIQRNGILVLSTLMPEFQWVSGQSDMYLRVRGTIQDPQLQGFLTLRHAKAIPVFLAEAMDQVYGGIYIRSGNQIDVRNVYGRLENNKRIYIDGTIPLLTPKDEGSHQSNKPKNRRLELFRDRGMLTIDIGQVVVQVEDLYYGSLSGRVGVTGAALKPTFGGRINLSNGALFVANPTPTTTTTSTTRKQDSDSVDESSHGEVLNGWSFEEHVPGIRDAEYNSVMETAATPRFEEATEFVKSRTPPVDFSELELQLGRKLQLVYPYFLNFTMRGALTLNGPSTRLEPTGTVLFPSGRINTLTTHMRLRQNETNTATFTRDSSKGQNGNEEHKVDGQSIDALDPLLDLALEDARFIVRAKNVRASKAIRGTEFYDKRGTRLGNLSDLIVNYVEEQRRALNQHQGILSQHGQNSMTEGDDESKVMRIGCSKVKGHKLDPTQLAFDLLFVARNVMMNTIVFTTQIPRIGLNQIRLYPAVFADEYLLREIPFRSEYGVGFEIDFGRLRLALGANLDGKIQESKGILRATENIKLVMERNRIYDRYEVEVEMNSLRISKFVRWLLAIPSPDSKHAQKPRPDLDLNNEKFGFLSFKAIPESRSTIPPNE